MAFRLRTLLLACSAILLSVAAEAQDGTISLVLTGEAYAGPPKFRLLADNREIGTGDVTNAVDSQKGVKLLFDKDRKLPASNTFTFKVQNIESISRFDVEFTNDDWAGVGKPGDRNLYLLSLSVGTSRKVPDGTITTIHEFAPTAFTAIMPKPGGSKITSEYAALSNRGAFRLVRPKGGWVGPGGASGGSSSMTASGCKMAQVEIKGFERNASNLSPKMLSQLAEVSKSLEGKSCSVVITAFAGGGSDSFRDGLSAARAQTTANELIKLGVSKESIRTETSSGLGRRAIIKFQ